MEVEWTIAVEEGAGEDYMVRVLDAIETDRSVYIQIAGEYGHLRVTEIRDDNGKDQ